LLDFEIFLILSNHIKIIKGFKTVPTIELYTTFLCPFCLRAKNLLKKKEVTFTEISVDGNPGLRQQMTERSGGGQTVPQIFIDGDPIGGSDELVAMEHSGELDRLLQIRE